LKVSANVKIAMQCFENFGDGKCPKCPPLIARLLESSSPHLQKISQCLK